ncbi:MAG: TrkA family potassium uptake protein [Clostridiales bacterium]|jgi:trk system potassium uptake protein TrkA|nr:TrkA family potassium uptake protein [Clostridiales bacterium]
MARSKQFAVLGLGRFGRSIVRTLSENGCDVLACDMDLEIVQDVSQYATHVLQTDVTDEGALFSLGLGNFDVVIIAIGTLEPSVLATVIAKESGAKMIISKAMDTRHKKILEKVGADRVVLPEWEMGGKVAMNLLTNNLITSNVIDYINLSDEYSIAEIEPKKGWVGHSLAKSNIRADFGLNVVAVKRNQKIIISPKPDATIEGHDVLVVIGETISISRYWLK